VTTVSDWSARTDADDSSDGLHESSYADIVERLFREFEAHLDLVTIEAVITQCRHQLRGSPARAMPELIERLARERLNVLARPLGSVSDGELADLGEAGNEVLHVTRAGVDAVGTHRPIRTNRT
jgi:transposase